MRQPIPTDPRATMPSVRCIDKGFQYVNHVDTDITKTFARARSQQASAAPTNVQPMRKAK